MSAPTTAPPGGSGRARELERRLAAASIGLAIVLFAVTGIVIWLPSLDDPRFVPTILAPITVVVALGALVSLTVHAPVWLQRTLIIAAMALWTPLIFEDDRWSITVMVIYVLAWSAGGLLSPILAVAGTVAWSAGWLAEGATWSMLAIPLSVLAGSFFVAWASDRIAADNETKDALIASLEASRRQLAVAERERGVLAERARFAAEIHDTLAQGFTSIVLLSRVGRRAAPDSASHADVLAQIEETATTNLDAARRLVGNARPAELDGTPLEDALRRQLHTVIGEDRSTMTVNGTGRAYGGAIEIAAFRATQEALLNARRHASAESVQLALHHLDDELIVEIIDDGDGFEPERPVVSGALSGGQGVQAMCARVAALGGDVMIDSAPGAGTTVSVRLPAGDVT